MYLRRREGGGGCNWVDGRGCVQSKTSQRPGGWQMIGQKGLQVLHIYYGRYSRTLLDYEWGKGKD